MDFESLFDEVNLGLSDIWSLKNRLDTKRILDYISKHGVDQGRDTESFIRERFQNMNKEDAEVLEEILELSEYVIEHHTDENLSSISIYEHDGHDEMCGLLKDRFGLKKGTITSLLFEQVPLPETNFTLPDWCITEEIQYSKDAVSVPNGNGGLKTYDVDNNLTTKFADKYPSTFCNWTKKIKNRDRKLNTPELATV
jgi:hypothetical protein